MPAFLLRRAQEEPKRSPSQRTEHGVESLRAFPPALIPAGSVSGAGSLSLWRFWLIKASHPIPWFIGRTRGAVRAASSRVVSRTLHRNLISTMLPSSVMRLLYSRWCHFEAVGVVGPFSMPPVAPPFFLTLSPKWWAEHGNVQRSGRTSKLRGGGMVPLTEKNPHINLCF